MMQITMVRVVSPEVVASRLSNGLANYRRKISDLQIGKRSRLGKSWNRWRPF